MRALLEPQRTPRVHASRLRMMAIITLLSTPLGLLAIAPTDWPALRDALSSYAPPVSLRTAVDALAWLALWSAWCRGRGTPVLKALGTVLIAVVSLTTLGACGGPLALAVFAFGKGLSARRTSPAGRPQLLTGAAGGALVAMGPLGALVAVLTVIAAFVFPSAESRTDRLRADTLVMAFMPLIVLAGVIYVGWMRTGLTPWALAAMAFAGDHGGLAASPWLQGFGGGAAASWPLLAGMCVLTAPTVPLALARHGRDEPARVAMILLAATLLAAGLLTAANLLADPRLLFGPALAANLIALPATAPHERVLGGIAAVAGIVLTLLCLAPLTPPRAQGLASPLAWRLGPLLDHPPAWGVAPEARRHLRSRDPLYADD